MVWSPGRFLKEGELVNTAEDRATGWLRFAGMRGKVTVKLEGGFHRDIRASRIHLVGWGRYKSREAVEYMAGFKATQTGTVECITAGLPPYEASVYPYIEWCSMENGRVWLELEPSQIEVIGEDWWTEVEPPERPVQLRNMTMLLRQVAGQVRKREYAALGRKPRAGGGQRWRAEWSVLPGLQLLPPKLRDLLPRLRSRKQLTAKSVAWVRYFTPDSHSAWWAAGFDGKDTFFGAHPTEGYFLVPAASRSAPAQPLAFGSARPSTSLRAGLFAPPAGIEAKGGNVRGRVEWKPLHRKGLWGRIASFPKHFPPSPR